MLEILITERSLKSFNQWIKIDVVIHSPARKKTQQTFPKKTSTQLATIYSLPSAHWICTTSYLQYSGQVRTKSSSEFKDEFSLNSDTTKNSIRTDRVFYKTSDFEMKIKTIKDYFKTPDKLKAESSRMCNVVAVLSKTSNNVVIQNTLEKRRNSYIYD